MKCGLEVGREVSEMKLSLGKEEQYFLPKFGGFVS